MRNLRVLVVTPAAWGSRKGNRITADRWARICRSLECRVTVAEEYAGQPCDVLVALHARKSASSVVRFRQSCPDKPLVVALTGTDLYRDLRSSKKARRSLELATRLILLQPDAIHELPRRFHEKSYVIFQSATAPVRVAPPRKDVFEVCVVGHLRAVKDPFRAAMAVRRLPAMSRVQVLQIGGALTDAMERRAHREMTINPRYRWLGELPYERAKQRMARCRLLVLSSVLEGGANVISEAIVSGVPVVSTHISGSIGLLGDNYPGYFEFGDTRGLAELLDRAETDTAFLADLKQRCDTLRSLFSPNRERAAWRTLLESLAIL